MTPRSSDKIARRVLVVDDDRDTAELTAAVVEMAGGESQTARSGLEAIDQAAVYKPDAIFLDIGLPDMSGYEVCQTIREQPWASDIPIIALTGWSDADDLDRSKEAGFDAHLVKPVDPADLLEVLSALS